MIQKTTPQQAQQVAANVDGRIMYQGESLEIISLSLLPGEKIPAHMNPSDVVFAGIEGKAIIRASDSEYTLNAGETIYISKNEQRAIENTGNISCRMYVIKIAVKSG